MLPLLKKTPNSEKQSSIHYKVKTCQNLVSNRNYHKKNIYTASPIRRWQTRPDKESWLLKWSKGKLEGNFLFLQTSERENSSFLLPYYKLKTADIHINNYSFILLTAEVQVKVPAETLA